MVYGIPSYLAYLLATKIISCCLEYFWWHVKHLLLLYIVSYFENLKLNLYDY